MTTVLRRHPLAAVVATAVLTASLFTGVLWRQHGRQGWPFSSAGDAPPAVGALPHSSPESTHDRVPVDVGGSILDQLGVRLEEVRLESLTQTTRAVATIVPDESRISHVHTRVSGWVEELDVSTTGQMVTAGQPLLRIFSQELLSSQTEYLAARQHAASGIATAVVAGGRTRLGVLGMTPAEIDAIERSGEPMRLVTVVAPRSGVVVNRGVTVGTSVDPSTTLLTIADLSRVWVLAEVPEASIPAVRTGATARLDFPASGRAPFTARIDFVYPTLTERTRTLRIRLSVANAGGVLRPGLFGTAEIEVAGPQTITVPRDAIVDTGRQQHVFVAVAGRFEPRPVTIGARLADRVEIRTGLDAGERVVAAGVFLLDSESRLRATGGVGGHQHGAPAAPAAAPGPQEGHGPAPSPPAADPHEGHGPASSPPVTDPHEGHGPPPPAAGDPHAGHRE
jgi:membrane fusion protein, copper/silver efflux system